eukprot:CAMPEP_0115046160 /NCGR_PEP_ID=MMETSP0216-20121206/48591_1 /TAXON_ID=223996 /ORGANISM="Protocruzia adherens, Strain Boccale" /LENGTH=440 /DNA_ID=CAMNT_0002429203 /DNA_START=18 /DNA_END=1337 /DNA_ORIENTATION=+
MVAFLSNVLFRAFIIAVRYAYSTHTALFLQTKIRRNIRKDFGIRGWQILKDDAAEKEVEIALIRTKIDQDLFQVQLMEPGSCPKYLDRVLSKYESSDRFNDRSSSRRNSTSLGRIRKQRSLWLGAEILKRGAKLKSRQDEDEYNFDFARQPQSEGKSDPRLSSPIPGRNIAREVLLNARDNQSRLIWTFILMAFAILMPTFVRLKFRMDPFGDSWTDVIVFTLLLLGSARRLFLMQSLTAMISVNKDYSFKLAHMSPLVDLFDIKNVLSWYKLRNLLMDVGQRFSSRIYVYFSAAVFGSLLTMLWLVGSIMGFIEVPEKEMALQTSYLGVYLVLLFLTLSIIMFNGASINDHFTKHRDLLLKNYSYYRDAQVYQDRLDSSLHYVNPMLTFAADKRKRFKNPQDFDLHLSELIKMTENIYTKLEMDELTEPYRILGIKVDW